MNRWPFLWAVCLVLHKVFDFSNLRRKIWSNRDDSDAAEAASRLGKVESGRMWPHVGGKLQPPAAVSTPSIHLPTTPTSHRKATGATNIPTFDHFPERHPPFPHPTTSYLSSLSVDCLVMYPCWDVPPINGGDCGLQLQFSYLTSK